ncbi:B-cell receptor CD22-like [Pygocentrus nattereri]|uniref:B-cell receptor CD22-like n=1 Tax=Pygocentrus nattereri TaxID=42514 RepID=UPI001890BB0E|nr:B-cell receptor CD22-like [Pygocentrus nattereri]
MEMTAPFMGMSLTVSLLFLIFICGVVAQDGWSVNYIFKSVCVPKRSTVFMRCTYTYPSDYSLQKAFWTKQWPAKNIEPPSLLDHPEFTGRVQYLGDKKHNCTLRLIDVRETDQSKYYFRFITDKPGGKYQGAGGVDLSVTDLQVEVPERVIEGDKVTLTCKTTCSLTVTQTFTWYRNGHPLSSRTDQLHLQPISRKDAGRYRCAVLSQNLHSPEVTLNVRYLQVEVPERVIEGDKVTLTCKTSFSLSYRPKFTWYRNGRYLSFRTDQLHLQPVSREDAGRYCCAVLDQNLYSPEVTLNVRYGPKSISVSISPSGEIVEGSSVTLTCSSDANPPVEYNWFKGTSSVGKGKTYTVKKISSVDSGEYKCRSSNKHGEKLSEALTLNVLYPPKSISVSINPSGEIVEGSSVTLTCSSDANPPVQNYTWFKKPNTGALQKSTSQIYSISNISSADSGEYHCMATNEHGSKYSEYKSLTVLYGPKSVSVSISPSGEIVEGSSVTLTCSSDANPPVQNYTWFKEGGSSPVGSGHSYRAPQSGSYYCEAQNEHGSQKSDAVTVTEKGVKSADLFAVLGVLAGCGCLFVIVAVLYFSKKKQGGSADASKLRQENHYIDMAVRSTTSDAAPDPHLSNQCDVHYACIVLQRVRNPRNAESSAVKASGTDEEVQYATVQHRHDKVVQKTEEDEVQYASIRFTNTGAANRSDVSTLDDVSVIYSSMK